MKHFGYGDSRHWHICLRQAALKLPHVVVLCCPLFFGCAALTNPVADGVPVRRLPPELLAPSKFERNKPSRSICCVNHRPGAPPLAAGDVLGVYIDGYLGDRNLAMPLFVNPPVQLRDQRRLPPATGYPVTVQPDGSIVLPSVPPLMVAGLTVNEARDAIRNLYVEKKKIPQENERIFVTLLQARQCEVVVLRRKLRVSWPAPMECSPAASVAPGLWWTSPARRTTCCTRGPNRRIARRRRL